MSKSMSKFGLVYANDRGTKSEILVSEYETGGLNPGDYTSLIGIVYDHRERDAQDFKGQLPNTVYGSFIVNEQVYSDLYGKMMTVMDAVIVDREQRKAIKDIVGQQLGTWRNKHDEAVRDTYKGTMDWPEYRDTTQSETKHFEMLRRK